MFREQLLQTEKITKEDITKLNTKTYYNGDEVKVGDRLLFAFLVIESSESEEQELKLITLSDKHTDNFVFYSKRETRGTIPTVLLK